MGFGKKFNHVIMQDVLMNKRKLIGENQAVF